MAEIREIVERRVKKLPSFSPAAKKIVTLLNSEGSDAAQKAGGIIETDPALAAAVLRAANSAAFSFRTEVTSVRRAVSLLGVRTVSGIAMAATAGNVLAGGGAGDDSPWQHSVNTAVTARILAEYCLTPLQPELAYIAGLLHDMGKAMLAEHYKEHSHEIRALMNDELVDDYHIAENEVLGISHTIAGALIAEHWGLPDLIVESIRRHHLPAAAMGEARPLVYVVHVADMLSQWSGWGMELDTLRYPLDTGYREVLNIASPRLERIMLTAARETFTTLDAYTAAIRN
jgi:putative nucleotidyltransferase with HDIG domain